jgi:hypothetical protein
MAPYERCTQHCDRRGSLTYVTANSAHLERPLRVCQWHTTAVRKKYPEAKFYRERPWGREEVDWRKIR